MAEFKAKIPKGCARRHVGNHGLENAMEEVRLTEFCQEYNLIGTNTFFKLPERQLIYLAFTCR